MNTHTEFQVGDIVSHFDNEYEIIEIDVNGKLKFKDYGSSYKPELFKLVKRANKATKWKLESDGTNKGTKVWINDELVSLLNVNFSTGVDSVPILTLTLR
jgi:hypothetical protein